MRFPPSRAEATFEGGESRRSPKRSKKPPKTSRGLLVSRRRATGVLVLWWVRLPFFGRLRFFGWRLTGGRRCMHAVATTRLRPIAVTINRPNGPLPLVALAKSCKPTLRHM